MGALYRAAENHWFSEIPFTEAKRSRRVSDEIYPSVLLGAHLDGSYTFDIVGGPRVPATSRARDTVRIPYIGGKIDNGLSTEMVAVDFGILTGPDTQVALGGEAVAAALQFWHDQEVQAAFYPLEAAAENGVTYLIAVEEGSSELTLDVDGGRVAYEVTNQGIVLATARVLVDHAFAQLPPSE
jgi:hypothetical protein